MTADVCVAIPVKNGRGYLAAAIPSERFSPGLRAAPRGPTT